MKKIPTLFDRDPATKFRTLMRTVHPDCEWVVRGEGIATRKYDGSSCLWYNNTAYKRCEWYLERNGPAPAPWLHHDFDPSQRSGHGWIPVGFGPDDTHHREAFGKQVDSEGRPLVEGATYELCGPRVQKNPEGFASHVLVRHGQDAIEGVPVDYDGLAAFLKDFPHEGIVWHHPDGRMAKIKRRDFR